MKTSQKGINLIKNFEGLELKAYLCPAGVYTIGYGTTVLSGGEKVSEDLICTEEEAELFLKHDLYRFEKIVNEVVTSPINQNQFDALVSFCYNLGHVGESLLEAINTNHEDTRIKDLFAMYCYAGNKYLPGLYKRRSIEYELYAT